MGKYRDHERWGRRRLIPVDECLICESSIYAHDSYGFFCGGYAHDDCIVFLRVQAALVRAAAKKSVNSLTRPAEGD